MVGPGRPTPRVVLDVDQREKLRRLSRARKKPRRLVQRAKIVLACADGETDTRVADRLGISGHTVAKWRRRFLEHGLESLHNKPRTGRRTLITHLDVARIIDLTFSPPPDGSDYWTAAAMATATGWSESTTRRKWRECGLRPDRLVCVKLNPDLVRYGTWSVAGVYQDSGQRAIAISVDARWSAGVAPLVWAKGVPRQLLPSPLETDYASDDHSPGGGSAGQRPFEDFLDAVATDARDGWELFLLVDSPGLHQVTLLRQWRAGQLFHVGHAISTEAWYAAAHHLGDMMVQRGQGCGAHGDDHNLATALEASEHGYVVWPDCHDAAHEGDSCKCGALRQSFAQAVKRLPGSKPRRYWKCECNRADCPRCCLRRYWNICDTLHRDWVAAFGEGKAASITLTYRAASALTSTEWLERAHRDLRNLQARWRRQWGAMPHHLWSLEFTVAGTPHFHILMPWESLGHIRLLRTWLLRTWASVTGTRPDPRTGHFYSVRVRVRKYLWSAINYLMKSVQRPLSSVAAPGTPPFRRWGRSQHWERAQRPIQRLHSGWDYLGIGASAWWEYVRLTQDEWETLYGPDTTAIADGKPDIFATQPYRLGGVGVGSVHPSSTVQEAYLEKAADYAVNLVDVMSADPPVPESTGAILPREERRVIKEERRAIKEEERRAIKEERRAIKEERCRLRKLGKEMAVAQRAAALETRKVATLNRREFHRAASKATTKYNREKRREYNESLTLTWFDYLLDCEEARKAESRRTGIETVSLIKKPVTGLRYDANDFSSRRTYAIMMADVKKANLEMGMLLYKRAQQRGEQPVVAPWEQDRRAKLQREIMDPVDS